MSADSNRHIEELYAVPPKEFTSARNAKAAALEAAGPQKPGPFGDSASLQPSCGR